MAFIADLAPYDYHGAAPDGIAVGWLEEVQPFRTGGCPEDVRNRLAELAEHPVRLMRGWHHCQFCWTAAGAPGRADHNPHLIVSHLDVARGNGELWLTTADGTNYVAPTLVVHYLDAHAYMPPQAFIAAVREGTRTGGLD
jgi:hypothetical protein